MGFQQLALAHELIVSYRDAKGQYLHAHGEEKRVLRDRIGALRQDLAIMSRATAGNGFDWAVEFAEVFERGGFDVVLANPPYVRADAQFKHLKGDEDTQQTAVTAWKQLSVTKIRGKDHGRCQWPHKSRHWWPSCACSLEGRWASSCSLKNKFSLSRHGLRVGGAWGTVGRFSTNGDH
jgi:hypothetical protein